MESKKDRMERRTNIIMSFFFGNAFMMKVTVAILFCIHGIVWVISLPFRLAGLVATYLDMVCGALSTVLMFSSIYARAKTKQKQQTEE